MKPDTQEFFVGYGKQMPAGVARFLRTRVITLLVAGGVVGAVLAATQRAFDPSRFEFGVVRSFEGIVHTDPYPTLMLSKPDANPGDRPQSCYYLVAPGKFGANELVAGAEGRRVRLDGSLIHREDQTMVEVAPGSVEVLGPSSAGDTTETLGEFTLRGEIVDSKCYLGVMKPGHLKPHRSCAIRCISGGIPPVFLVRDEQGTARYLMLVSADGKPVNRQVLDRVAVPLEITGIVERHNNLLVLRADPSSYRRI